MKHTVLYFHGKGGSAGEAAHYRALFPDAAVIGLDYKAETPWEAAAEFPALFDRLCGGADAVTLIANSIGAYFAMHALAEKAVRRAFLISPIVDMESLILGMMRAAGVSEDALREAGEIAAAFGETLSWEYLRYVREHPLAWNTPTEILYGERDALTSFDAVAAFAGRIGAGLTVCPAGEHWFHTAEQMAFLDRWILEKAAALSPQA